MLHSTYPVYDSNTRETLNITNSLKMQLSSLLCCYNSSGSKHLPKHSLGSTVQVPHPYERTHKAIWLRVLMALCIQVLDYDVVQSCLWTLTFLRNVLLIASESKKSRVPIWIQDVTTKKAKIWIYKKYVLYTSVSTSLDRNLKESELTHHG
jgi:hypothetical protein